MSVPRARQPVRWPPQTFRVRLTLLFAALFLAAGAALLGISYVLAVNQPDNVPPVTLYQFKLAFHCKQGKESLPKTAEPVLSSKCAHAIAATAAHEAAAGLRRQTLERLLAYSLVALGAMTVVSGGLGWVMAGRVLRPR